MKGAQEIPNNLVEYCGVNRKTDKDAQKAYIMCRLFTKNIRHLVKQEVNQVNYANQLDLVDYYVYQGIGRFYSY